ncbi:MAG TPA: FAD-binding oxidoreductase [Candidatus Dormibacteraeota bacterium]|nr:FAD-binding oxidoreductase [Candidatus Dormibacteraeota bacterium]
MSSTAPPASAECVIVGGGVVGCSLAYHLARGGMRPLLLERGGLGEGSTARNAGGVRQQFSTEVNVRVGMLSHRMLERFPEEIGATADLREIGYLFLAGTAEEAEQFARNVEMQHRVGLREAELLDVERARELVPELRTDDLHAATFCPSDGLAGPNEVTGGYAAAARRLGAAVVEGCEVAEVTRDRGRVSGVRTTAGERVSAGIVVNCAGPYASVVGRMAGVEIPVRPFRRHIFVTEPFRLSRPVPFTVDFHTSFYMHPEGEGLLLGMSDPDEPASFDTSVSWDFLEHLIEHATWRVPALERAEIHTGWAGLYEVSPDNQAIVGESPQLAGLWLCCGFSGHGFMQAPAMGHLLAEVLLGREPEIDLSPFDPARFEQGEGLQPESAVI